MRFLRKFVFLGLIVSLGTATIHAQQPKASSTLDETLTWLRDAIAKNAGFSFSRDTTSDAKIATTSIEPGKDQLTYQVNVDSNKDQLVYQMRPSQHCHLTWRAVASGDESLQFQFPSIDMDEDLATINASSVKIESFDLAHFAGAGASQPTDDTPADRLSTAIRPAAQGYWKVAGLYVYRPSEEEQAFGFIFSDLETALQVAQALSHVVDICRGPQPPDPPGTGCDVVKANPGVPAKERPSAGYSGMKWSDLTNNSSVPMRCMVYFTRNGKLDIPNGIAIDIAPGHGYSGYLMQKAPWSDQQDNFTTIWCYEKGTVDTHGNACSTAALPAP